MIILQHDHIIESEGVVGPSADPDGIFFQEAKVGSGLTGIQDPRAEFLQFVNILAGEGGNAAHTLHTIKDKPFASQDSMDGRFCSKSRFSVFHGAAIMLKGGKGCVWFFYPENFFTDLHSCRIPFTLNLPETLSPGIGGEQCPAG